MIESPLFWKEEHAAPLLNRNGRLLAKEANCTVLERVANWRNLAERQERIQVEMRPDCNDEACLRIFELDAERTFREESHRQRMVLVLKTVYHETQDYHQGLGFLVAFLMLLLNEEDTVAIATAMHRHYVPGYFKAAPTAYVRDARVFAKLLEEHFPECAAHTTTHVPPEAYCSKWFVGMCVHVLPFPALIEFLEALLVEGQIFLFKFGLALVQNTQADLLAAKDASRIFAILRLDASLYPDSHATSPAGEPGSFFTHVVSDALNFDISDATIEELRTQVEDEMRLEAEKRKQRELEVERISYIPD